jgi:hypothetical protein
VDERQIWKQGGGYPSYPVSPPPRRGNTLRALSLLLVASLLAGFVLFGLLQIKEVVFSGNAGPIQEQVNSQPTEQTTTPPQEQTVIIHKKEKSVPYPRNRVQVADRFGGNPEDWSQNIWIASWKYKSDRPIAIPYGRNVTLYTRHITLYWD